MEWSPGFSMERWIEVARVDELQPGEGKTVIAAGERVALFNDRGDLLAIDDGCPHQGASLGEGLLHEGVRSLPTRCRNGAVQVKLGDD